jgi:hypothetical protein
LTCIATNNKKIANINLVTDAGTQTKGWRDGEMDSGADGQWDRGRVGQRDSGTEE